MFRCLIEILFLLFWQLFYLVYQKQIYLRFLQTLVFSAESLFLVLLKIFEVIYCMDMMFAELENFCLVESCLFPQQIIHFMSHFHHFHAYSQVFFFLTIIYIWSLLLTTKLYFSKDSSYMKITQKREHDQIVLPRGILRWGGCVCALIIHSIKLGVIFCCLSYKSF